MCNTITVNEFIKMGSQKFEKSYFDAVAMSVFDSKDIERFNSKNIFNKFSCHELKFIKI